MMCSALRQITHLQIQKFLRERERRRDRDRDRETETDIYIERDRETETKRQSQTKRGTDRDRETEMETERETHRENERERQIQCGCTISHPSHLMLVKGLEHWSSLDLLFLLVALVSVSNSSLTPFLPYPEVHFLG